MGHWFNRMGAPGVSCVLIHFVLQVLYGWRLWVAEQRRQREQAARAAQVYRDQLLKEGVTCILTYAAHMNNLTTSLMQHSQEQVGNSVCHFMLSHTLELKKNATFTVATCHIEALAFQKTEKEGGTWAHSSRKLDQTREDQIIIIIVLLHSLFLTWNAFKNYILVQWGQSEPEHLSSWDATHKQCNVCSPLYLYIEEIMVWLLCWCAKYHTFNL